MVKYCSAKGCKNRFVKGRGITFHSFPHKNKELLEKWVRAVRRENWQPSKYSTLCSEHFIPADFYPCQRRTQIKEDVVPSIFVNAPPLPPSLPPIKLKKKEQISNSSIGKDSDVAFYLCKGRTQIKDDILDTESLMDFLQEEPVLDDPLGEESHKISTEITRADYLKDLK